MEKSKIIEGLMERINDLEKWRKERKKTDDKKKPAKEDEEVCQECGGDLLFVEEGIVFCPKCEVYYEHEGSAEE